MAAIVAGVGVISGAVHVSARTVAPQRSVEGPSVAQEELERGRVVLREVLAEPGFEFQLCGRRALPIDKLSVYSFSRGEIRLAPDRLERLRAIRSGAIAATVEGLDRSIDEFVGLGTRGVEDAVWTSYEYTHRLAILVDLNAVEALPALVATADRTRGPLHKIPHSETLTTITAILRQERHAPLLASELERVFKESLERYFEKRKGALLGCEGELVVSQRRYHRIDPIHGLPHAFDLFHTHAPQVPLTPELDATIVGWARDFLASTPRERWQAARGMDPWPTVR